LGVALAIFAVGGGFIGFYECYWSKGEHSHGYNALNLALAALFFRSCMPEVAESADSHSHLNPPPLHGSSEAGTPSKHREEV
jgi:hypothetical protein